MSVVEAKGDLNKGPKRQIITEMTGGVRQGERKDIVSVENGHTRRNDRTLWIAFVTIFAAKCTPNSLIQSSNTHMKTPLTF